MKDSNIHEVKLYRVMWFKIWFTCFWYRHNSSKLVSAIFYQIFIFSSNERPSKTMQNVFLFHLKSFFCSWDIQTFVIFSLLFQNFIQFVFIVSYVDGYRNRLKLSLFYHLLLPDIKHIQSWTLTFKKNQCYLLDWKLFLNDAQYCPIHILPNISQN